MRFITIEQLTDLPDNSLVRVRSIGFSLYRVEFVTDEATYVLAETPTTSQTFHNITSIKDALRPFAFQHAVLTQSSAYDEMTGLETRLLEEVMKPQYNWQQRTAEPPNTLELPLDLRGEF